MSITQNDRVFSGVYPTGILYADRLHQKGGDYARLAFLSFSTLTLEFEPGCPVDLRKQIQESANPIIARRGQSFQISWTGQTVMLGSALPDTTTPC